MSRTQEVEQAMSYRNGPLSCVLTMSDGSKRYGHEILAAEVERLEAKCCTVELLKNLHKTAEARVAMADQSIDELQAALNTQQARVAELEAQNARLRAALEDVSLLAHCISKAGPLNTPDLETAWRKFDLISVKAAEALVDRKAALNGEEAST